MMLFLESIGTMEVVLILMFVLLFFGPKSIPDISRTIGRTMRDIRDATQNVKDEITKSTLDLRKDFDAQKERFKNELDISKEASEVEQKILESPEVSQLKEVEEDLKSSLSEPNNKG